MFLAGSPPQRTDNPFEGMTDRQIEACAMRYGEGPRLTPLRLIGLRMGIKRSAVCCLIARGIANLRRNGYDSAVFTAPARKSA